MSTEAKEYSERLLSLQTKWWKRWFALSLPYRLNLLSLKPGRTLEIGCGIGRCLDFLSGQGIGVDHNPASVEVCRSRGFLAYTPKEFFESSHVSPGGFDSLLFSHVLEHMTVDQAVELIRQYEPYLKTNGQLILITPQERGQASDSTHVEFMDFQKLQLILAKTGFRNDKQYSYPFPRFLGKLFIYNEFVVVGIRNS